MNNPRATLEEIKSRISAPVVLQGDKATDVLVTLTTLLERQRVDLELAVQIAHALLEKHQPPPSSHANSDDREEPQSPTKSKTQHLHANESFRSEPTRISFAGVETRIPSRLSDAAKSDSHVFHIAEGPRDALESHKGQSLLSQIEMPHKSLLVAMCLSLLFPVFSLVVLFSTEHPTQTSLLGTLSLVNFRWTQTAVYTTTCMLVGLGSEIVFGVTVTRYLQVSESVETLWMFAQLMFPLLLTIAVFARSVFALPFLVFGLWKLGCPEVVGSFLGALSPNYSNLQRISFLMNAYYTFLHHSAATFIVCGVVTGAIRLDRYLASTTMPLVVQHWFPLLKYRSKMLYVVCMLVAEAWWEVEVFCATAHVQEEVQIAGFVLVGAHWGYLAGGLLSLIDEFQTMRAANSNRSSTTTETNSTNRKTTETSSSQVQRGHTLKLWNTVFANEDSQL